MISVFVSRCLNVKAVKKAVVKYEEIKGAKINFDKSKDQQLGVLRSGIHLPRPFHWSNGHIHIHGVWFGSGLQLQQNWSEVQAKVEAHESTWLRRHLSLKGRAEVCAMYIFFLILYYLSVLFLPKSPWLVLK